MKKFVLLVLPVLFLLIGFDYGMAEVAKVSPELAAARAKYDTPFIKKYRPRYEANNINLSLIVEIIKKQCAKNCTEKDRESIKKLAESEDMFSLSLLSDLNPESFSMDLLKISADKGEASSIRMYGLLKIAGYEGKATQTDYESIEKKYFKAVKNNYVIGYYGLQLLYVNFNNISAFCNITKEGYNKFGFEFISSYFLTGGKSSKLFFENCTLDTKEDILSKIGNEGKLVQGYINVKNGEYEKAYGLFSEIYKPNDGSKISANAGYCLGMMNYYGKGIVKNLEKGRKLLKESFDNGVFHPYTPEYASIPTKLEIITYSGYTCSQFNNIGE